MANPFDSRIEKQTHNFFSSLLSFFWIRNVGIFAFQTRENL